MPTNVIQFSLSEFSPVPVPVPEVLEYLHVHCAGLTNQLLSCWIDPRITWKNTDTAIVGDRWTGVGGHHSLHCYLVQKKSHLGCMISFQLPIGFQNLVVINKIHP